MATTIHIPEDLLNEVDKKSAKLHISRNKYICMVLKKDLVQEWPEKFLKKKCVPQKELTNAVDGIIKKIKSKRTNKNPLTF